MALASTDVNMTSSASSKCENKNDSVKFGEDDFQKHDMIGKGAFSCVFSATHKAGGINVALKEISRRIVHSNPQYERALKKEVNIHRKLRHPHIVRLFNYYVTKECVVLVMELCERGTLRTLLSLCPDDGLDELTVAKYGRQVGRALRYLHEHEIIHRDLKLENVLVDSSGEARLSDFGWASEYIENDSGRKTTCGTLDYLSPEMILREAHTTKTDVWSFGVLMFELLFDTTPFYDPSENQTKARIVEGEPNFPRAVSSLCVDFFLKVLAKDPAERPTMRDALAHPWLQQRRGSSVSSAPMSRSATPVDGDLVQ